MSIVNNKKRIGRFTSSKAHLLIGSGKGTTFSKSGISYITEKLHERQLGRSLDIPGYSRAAYWGLFLEQYVYQFLELDYEIVSEDTKVNPHIEYHAGSADLIKHHEIIADIKCYEPRKFCRIVQCFKEQNLEIFKAQFKEEYWQLVSNAMIHGLTRAESIVYMPSEDDLKEIRDMAQDYDGADQWKYRFIYESKDYELAYIPDGSMYEPMNRYEFEIPKGDFQKLQERLIEAEEYLQNLMNR